MMWAGILVAGEFPNMGSGRSVLLLAAGLVIRISRARGPEAVAAPRPSPAPSY